MRECITKTIQRSLSSGDALTRVTGKLTQGNDIYSPGTNVTFSWTSGHNLVKVDEASYTSCAGLSPTSPATGPVTWPAPRDTGTHYFACGVPGHCSKGMKAKVEVAKVCLL